MPIQNVNQYTELLAPGIEGSTAQGAVATRYITGVNETEAMPYGRVVQFDATGTSDKSVKLTDGATPKPLGITALTHFDQSFLDTLTGVAQVSTVTVGGVATDGAYTITIDGVDVTVTRAGGVPAANDDIATALRAAINADPTVSQVVTAGGAAADVVITRDEAGSFSVAVAAPAPGTLTHALTTGGEPDGIQQNEEANVCTRGVLWIRPEDAVTPASGVFFRTTANAGVGTALGALRGADDGANTEDISNRARWLTSSEGGADGALAMLEFDFLSS